MVFGILCCLLRHLLSRRLPSCLPGQWTWVNCTDVFDTICHSARLVNHDGYVGLPLRLLQRSFVLPALNPKPCALSFEQVCRVCLLVSTLVQFYLASVFRFV